MKYVYPSHPNTRHRNSHGTFLVRPSVFRLPCRVAAAERNYTAGTTRNGGKNGGNGGDGAADTSDALSDGGGTSKNI